MSAVGFEATLAMLPELAGRASTDSLRPAETLAPRPAAGTTTSDATHPPSIDDLPLIDLDEGELRAGDLRALSTLGEGGMGRVVLASQRSLRRRVAVKTLQAHAGGDGLVLEGVITGMLEHPNIPPVHALSRDPQGRPVLVMKNIEGITWAEVLRDASHPLRATSPLFSGGALAGHVEVLSQVCNALELAHARGVVHRDVKPENVMLGPYGEVYLIDWGIAFHAGWNEGAERTPIVGTPAFMAPEMVLGELPDARTDVYLLGATLHAVLTGAPPHAATDLREALLHAYESPPPTFGPDVPTDLAELCRRALARERADRPASARAFRDAARGHLSHRASIRLCAEASARAGELRASLEDPAHDPSAIARLQHECRYGYAQALREWPENPEAIEGLRGVLRDLARHELAQDNPRGARAFFSEMPGADPELDGEIARLERTHRERAEEERARRELAREMDLANAARERTIVALVGLGFVAAVFLWRVLQPVGGVALAARQAGMLTTWIVLMAAVTLPLAVFWRRLSRHAVNRQMIQLLFVTGFAVALHRVSGVVLLPSAASTLVGDLLLLGALGVMVPSTATKAFRLGGALCLVGVAPLLLAPEHAGILYNLVSVAAASTVLLTLRREQARRS